MPIERLRPSFSFDEERLKELKKIAPEAFADGKINWGALKEALGEYLEAESGEVENFGLFWPGKKVARKIASIPSRGTLVPVFGEGIKADGTPDSDGVNDSHNIFIEGDNLEVLKILQKSYAGRIKMIYIDPPYNTGNDFVYDDDFTEPLEEYLRKTGQIDGEGKPLTTNKKSDGRFHSKWLSMMYPRLRLARNLLREDGVIFVSIDDNEIHNLRAIMNEIFGEENFISNLVWQSRTSISNDQEISLNHNHTIIFSKERGDLYFTGLELNSDEYDNPDNDPRGPWKLVPLDANKPGGDTKYGIINPTTGIEYFPPNGRSWAINRIDFQKLLKDNRIKFGKNNDSSPKRKLFLRERIEKGDNKTPSSIILDCGTTKDGTTEIMDLFDNMKVFSYPKPVKLLKRFMEFSLEENDIVLDFFAGSCSTGHALFDFNKSRTNKFIMVSLPEILDPTKREHIQAYDFCVKNSIPSLLTEVSKERLRRAIKRFNYKGGFIVYRLVQTCFNSWQNFQERDVNKFDQALDLFNHSPLTKDWNKDKLLTEILLLEGFPLDALILKVSIFNKNEVKLVSSETSVHQLFICFDDKINEDTIINLDLKDKDIFICFDTAISDQDKLRLSEKGSLKTI